MVRPLQGLAGSAGKVGGDGFSVFGGCGLRGDGGRKLSREEGDSRCEVHESSYARDIFSCIIIYCCHNEIVYSMTALSPDVGISGD